MTTPRRSDRQSLAIAVVIAVLLAVVLGTAAVWTNTLGAADRYDRLADRVRLVIDPPPDREIAPIVEVTESTLPEVKTPTSETGATDAARTPRPKRKPVDVKLRLKPRSVFASQFDKDWCAPAGAQMVLAMHGAADNSVGFQKTLASSVRKYESWRDSHNGGWGPASIAEALETNGVKGYEVRSYGNRGLALRDTARALSLTKAPVILIAWRGAHTWVMTGYRADADPTIFRDAKVTGTYIYDPWYPRISSIWGASDEPGTFQDHAEMERNYLRWDRPEGDYKDRDGKFLAVVPTIPLKDQAAASP